MQISVYRSMRPDARSRHVGRLNNRPHSSRWPAPRARQHPDGHQQMRTLRSISVAYLLEVRRAARPATPPVDEGDDRPTIPPDTIVPPSGADPVFALAHRLERPSNLSGLAPAPLAERPIQTFDHPFFPAALPRPQAVMTPSEALGLARTAGDVDLEARKLHCRWCAFVVIAACALISAWTLGARRAAAERAARGAIMAISHSCVVSDRG